MLAQAPAGITAAASPCTQLTAVPASLCVSRCACVLQMSVQCNQRYNSPAHLLLYQSFLLFVDAASRVRCSLHPAAAIQLVGHERLPARLQEGLPDCCGQRGRTRIRSPAPAPPISCSGRPPLPSTRPAGWLYVADSSSHQAPQVRQPVPSSAPVSDQWWDGNMRPFAQPLLSLAGSSSTNQGAAGRHGMPTAPQAVC